MAADSSPPVCLQGSSYRVWPLKHEIGYLNQNRIKTNQIDRTHVKNLVKSPNRYADVMSFLEYPRIPTIAPIAPVCSMIRVPH